MTILVTGGAGFIGSHTVVCLQNAGFEVVILDNFSNAEPFVLEAISEISGKRAKFYEGNCNDAPLLQQIFAEQQIDGVIHFAAAKAVGESVENPLKYYANNVAATVVLLQQMQVAGISNIVFSSSCTVYGEPKSLPVTEQSEIQVANSPYGNTKQICEEILKDTAASAQPIKAIALRYFNPIGAHESSLIGELPKGTPNNLVPFITQVAIGKRPALQVFGNDYPTPDGSCIRDYIHVVDLAEAHMAALDVLLKNNEAAYFDYVNIGTGKGSSVLEVIETFEKISGAPLNYVIKPRRSGDVIAVYADVEKAKRLLGWQAKKTLADALADAWSWEKKLAEN